MFKPLLIGAVLTASSFAFAGPQGRPSPSTRSDRFDVEQGRRLLREYELSRGAPALVRNLEHRALAFIDAELEESRRDSRTGFGRERAEERQNVRALRALRDSFLRLEGRVDRRAFEARRRLLGDAVAIAERDLRDTRDERFTRR